MTHDMKNFPALVALVLLEGVLQQVGLESINGRWAVRRPSQALDVITFAVFHRDAVAKASVAA